MSEYGSGEFGSGGFGSEESGATSSLNSLGHSFNIHDTQLVFNTQGATGGLKYVQKKNQFDDFGAMLSLQRIAGETNWEYKRRIHDAGTNLANSSYRGLVNGITRELGLSLFNALRINPKVDHEGNFLATDPYIRFDGVYLKLYSDYANNQLDWAIDRFEPGGNYEHLGRLVEMVNTTAFFEANLLADVDEYTRSMTVLNQSNRQTVTFERIPQSTKFKLKNDHLVRGTVFFANRTTFRTEVLSEDDVDQAGKYWIDYSKGIVRVFTIPTKSDSVRYQYSVHPFTAVASPVILHDVSDDNFKVKMFNTILQDNGTYELGAPTELGVDIVNELMSVVPMYWGI